MAKNQRFHLARPALKVILAHKELWWHRNHVVSGCFRVRGSKLALSAPLDTFAIRRSATSHRSSFLVNALRGCTAPQALLQPRHHLHIRALGATSVLKPRIECCLVQAAPSWMSKVLDLVANVKHVTPVSGADLHL